MSDTLTLTDAVYQILNATGEVTGTVTNIVTDIGTTIGQGVKTVINEGNGVATELTQLVTGAGASLTATTTGLVALDVGLVGTTIAPALGIAAGVGLYNLAPTFWDSVADELWKAGETIGGKVVGYINSTKQQIAFSEKTLNIFKNAFIKAGVYSQISYPEFTGNLYTFTSTSYPRNFNLDTKLLNLIKPFIIDTAYDYGRDKVMHSYIGGYLITNKGQRCNVIDAKSFSYLDVDGRLIEIYSIRFDKFDSSATSGNLFTADGYSTMSGQFVSRIGNISDGNKIINYVFYQNSGEVLDINQFPYPYLPVEKILELLPNFATLYYYTLPFYLTGIFENLQPGATYPTEADSVATTFPGWIPWDQATFVPGAFPMVLPVVNPLPTQEEAQAGTVIPNDDAWNDWLSNVLGIPRPVTNPFPDTGVVDPDTPVTGDEIIDTPIDVPIDPVVPTPPIPVTPVIPPPELPETVQSNALFTVYNPTIGELNQLGNFLWSNDILDMLVKIWSNPLEAIISLTQVYCQPTTGSYSDIILGNINSQVQARLVTNQFITINCGTISVEEIKHNATDYIPFVQLHLYLPFIGIVELDTNEIMSGDINIKYIIDVYTGTCLAIISSIREPDMPNGTVLYQFSGNCSQQIPITSNNYSGFINSVISATVGGLMMASGGEMAMLAGASKVGHSVVSDMVHVGHSGSLSANAGIMSYKKPYLIITRQQGYDANNYNQLYGFPANKTVYLGNCSGFVKVKVIRLNTPATITEQEEILQLLENGVIC